MREVQASEAEAHLPHLLDEVEHGETIVITRQGRPIARLVPGADRRPAEAEAQAAIARIEARRTRAHRVTPQELLTSRYEGHKY